jgi:hypothetical protein
MPVVRLQQKGYQFEDRVMEGYAMAYRAYLARRDLPGRSRHSRTLSKSARSKTRSRTVVRKLSSSLRLACRAGRMARWLHALAWGHPELKPIPDEEGTEMISIGTLHVPYGRDAPAGRKSFPAYQRESAFPGW